MYSINLKVKYCIMYEDVYEIMNLEYDDYEIKYFKLINIR